MPPCLAEDKNVDKKASALQLNALRNAMPPEVFEKSLTKSMAYLVFDYAMWGTSLALIWSLVHSIQWSVMPMWQKGIATFVYWNVAGFFMWCLFVVGHDCGHTTFSENETVNNTVGHLVHGSILVPFFPWQV